MPINVVDEVSWLGVKGRGAFPAPMRQWLLPGLAAHSCGGSAGLAQALAPGVTGFPRFDKRGH